MNLLQQEKKILFKLSIPSISLWQWQDSQNKRMFVFQFKKRISQIQVEIFQFQEDVFEFQKVILPVKEGICSLILIKKMLIICAIVGAVIVAVIVTVAAVIATLPEQVIISEGN